MILSSSRFLPWGTFMLCIKEVKSLLRSNCKCNPNIFVENVRQSRTWWSQKRQSPFAYSEEEIRIKHHQLRSQIPPCIKGNSHTGANWSGRPVNGFQGTWTHFANISLYFKDPIPFKIIWCKSILWRTWQYTKHLKDITMWRYNKRVKTNWLYNNSSWNICKMSR